MDLTNQITKFLPKAMSIHPFDIFAPGELKLMDPRKGYLVFMNDTLSKARSDESIPSIFFEATF